MRTLLEGLKSEAAKAGVDAEVEDLDDTVRVGIETLGELNRFLSVATSKELLPFRFDVYVPAVNLADVVLLFLNQNEGQQPPSAT